MTQGKMSFNVDLVSEDSFYENMLLGVTKFLEANPRVSKVLVEQCQPCERTTITNWEQRHSAQLPEDLRNFYASTDGFILKWSFTYSADEILPVGKIRVNTLSELLLTPTLKEYLDIARTKEEGQVTQPPLNTKSKVLELDDCKPFGKVCLVNVDGQWSIWLLTKEGIWHELANNFTSYMRMALVYLGLPAWQAVATGSGMIPWAEQLYNLLAPHLLNEMEPQTELCPEPVVNRIDGSIFKSSTKHYANRPNAANRQPLIKD